MIYLWDTDTFSMWERKSPEVRARLAALPDDAVVTISAVTVYETLRGRAALVARARDEGRYAKALSALAATVAALRRWPVLHYTAEAAAQFARLRAGRGSRGTADLRIAAIAVTADATLVTRNTSDFGDLPGLRVENWVD